MFNMAATDTMAAEHHVREVVRGRSRSFHARIVHKRYHGPSTENDKYDYEKERWGVHSRDPLCIGEENVSVRGWRLCYTE